MHSLPLAAIAMDTVCIPPTPAGYRMYRNLHTSTPYVRGGAELRARRRPACKHLPSIGRFVIQRERNLGSR